MIGMMLASAVTLQSFPTAFSQPSATYHLHLLSSYVDSMGARCLDGSAPGFYVAEGDPNKWILFLEGGGWCMSYENCLERAQTQLGSSKSYPAVITSGYEGQSGFMSNDSTINPVFWDFTKVYFKYCDGGSFAGNYSKPIPVDGPNGTESIWFRGHQNLEAGLTELYTNLGMNEASELVLGGCSAGGLAVSAHCEEFGEWAKAHAKADAKVRCMSDAGYFPDLANVNGVHALAYFYNWVFMAQNASWGVNQACLASKSPDDHWRCFFPQEVVPHLTIPVFYLNSGYDSWQMKAILAANNPPPRGIVPGWENCISNFSTCNSTQMQIIQSYHFQYLDIFEPILATSSPHGAFVTSCLAHCESGAFWAEGATIDNRTIGEVVASWYQGNQEKQVMCPYPCTEPGSSCGIE